MPRILQYTDSITGSSGYLVYDRSECRLAAGGCRMQAGLTADTLVALAARMTLKQRVLGTNVDGAKCGIDHDPRSADADAVLRRFLSWLDDELRNRFSMGCDMGTRFESLERLAGQVGIPSVKYAVRTAQELTDEEFRRRIALLKAPVRTRTVGQRRAGHALAHAALAAAWADGHPAHGLRVGLQGFGNLGRAAAESLVEAGAELTAIADEYGCVVDPRGLDVHHMLKIDQSQPVPTLLARPLCLSPQALFDLPLDVLVLAAGADAITTEQAAVLPVPVVVVGANCGLSAAAERILHKRGVLVVPDFIGGIGGSASMEALFGPVRTPSPAEVLDSVGRLVTELVTDILDHARSSGLPTGQVAANIAAAAQVSPDHRPYGHSPYLTARHQPAGDRVAAAARRRAVDPTGGAR